MRHTAERRDFLKELGHSLTLREYGYDGSGPIRQPGSPSGYLLPWEALDDYSQSLEGSPCQFVVIGEFRRLDDGMRYPDLAINPEWMRAKGYVRRGRNWVLE